MASSISYVTLCLYYVQILVFLSELMVQVPFSQNVWLGRKFGEFGELFVVQ